MAWLDRSLFEAIVSLRDATLRRSGARRLASLLGARDALFFVEDPSLGGLLPAPGLPQPEAGRWREFLAACLDSGSAQAHLPYEGAHSVPLAGWSAVDGSVLVLVEPAEAPFVEPVLLLLPLVAEASRRELWEQSVSASAGLAAASWEEARRLASIADAARTSAERALLVSVRSERSLRKIVDMAQEGIALLDDGLRIRWANPRFISLFGDVHDHPLQERVAEAERAGLERVLRDSDAQSAAIDLLLLDAAGRQRSTLVSARRIPGADGEEPGWLVLITDITERRRAQTDLAQAQKLHALGQLAGGVAHDFNNLLTVIRGHSALARKVAQDERVQSSLAAIDHAAERASRITEQLLGYARKRVLETRRVAIDAPIRQATEMLKHLLPSDIDLVTDFAPDSGVVRVEPALLEQVVVNLVLNARDAMPDGGRIVVGSYRTRGPEDQRVAQGDWAVLEVRDTGTGVGPAVLARMFEPFFTTKALTKGTGLGLAVVDGFVRQCGGHITVDSAMGEGTRIRVWLPRMEGADAPEAVEAPTAPEAGGGRLVVVAEDEEAVRELVCRTLQEAGLRTLAASNGQEAIDLVGSLGAEPDLLLTDVLMRPMGGHELARVLRQAHPDLTVVFMSGTDRDAVADGSMGSGDALLTKPFSPDRLVQTVLRAMTGERAEGSPNLGSQDTESRK